MSNIDNLDNEDYPSVTMGRAAELLGVQPAFLRRLDAAGVLSPTRTDGNNVNLDTETVMQTETGLRYQLAINALDGKYALLRSALRTS